MTTKVKQGLGLNHLNDVSRDNFSKVESYFTALGIKPDIGVDPDSLLPSKYPKKAEAIKTTSGLLEVDSQSLKTELEGDEDFSDPRLDFYIKLRTDVLTFVKSSTPVMVELLGKSRTYSDYIKVALTRTNYLIPEDVRILFSYVDIANLPK